MAGGVTTVSEVWNAALCESRLTDPLPDDSSLAELAGLARSDAHILARHQLLALAAVESAWRSAGLPEHRNRLRGESSKHRNPRFGCVSGSSLGGLAAMETEMSMPGFRPTPYSMSRWRGNSVGAVTALRYALGASEFSINAASATGAQAVFLAGTMIRAGLADLVVAVTGDSLLPGRMLESMRRNGSTSKATDSVPLAATRSGMTPSEGAASLILESQSHAVARGAVPLAEWIGGSSVNEARHLMAPDDSAMALEESFNQLMSDSFSPNAGRLPSVDWISLHATGTPRFDRAEIGSLKRVFRSGFPWISAFKRITGHALGASGLIEAALIAEGLNSSTLPPWPSGIDPSLGIEDMRPIHQPRPELALQVAQGMGGTLVLNLFSAV